MCRGRRARILLHLHRQREKIVLRGSRAGLRFGCRNHPSRRDSREEPGTLTQGGALFSLVPLVWESNPKLQGGWCKSNHQAREDSAPHCGTKFC